MADTWYLDECAIETRLARRTAGRLAGIWHYPKVATAPVARLGEVYLARVGAHGPHAGGSFLDLGAAGEGFLRASAARPPPEGSQLLATVVQEAVGGKAPRLMAGVRLEGRSETLAWDEGREQFHSRTSGAVPNERQRALLLSELKSLLETVAGSPRRVHEAPSAARKVAHLAHAGDRIKVAGAGLLGEVRAQTAHGALDLATAIEPSPADLFEREGLESEIEAALEPVVALRGGGRLIVEMTQALTAIDVDAGAGRAQDANEEAARVLAFEIASRGLAGTIVVDFAQVRGRGTMSQFGTLVSDTAEQLDIALEIGVGRRGLLDIRRPRAQAPLAAVLTRAGITHLAVPRVLSFPAQAARVARAVEHARPASHWDLRVPVAMHAWLQGGGQAFRDAIVAATPARLTFTPAAMGADSFELVG
ncbi:MAG: ribonuclease E/G [Alphaproteobacteria bacterium]